GASLPRGSGPRDRRGRPGPGCKRMQSGTRADRTTPAAAEHPRGIPGRRIPARLRGEPAWALVHEQPAHPLGGVQLVPEGRRDRGRGVPLGRGHRGYGAGSSAPPPHAGPEASLHRPVPPVSDLLDRGAAQGGCPGPPATPVAPRAHPLALAPPIATVGKALGIAPLDRPPLLCLLRGARADRGAGRVCPDPDRVLSRVPIAALLLGLPVPGDH